jgi:REP element-mobilizing transposase RayT
MPDHLHGILRFEGQPGDSPSLATVVGQFKQRSTKRIRARRLPDFTWQERFYDQVLFDDEALQRYRVYVQDNPRHWSNGPVETPQSEP